MSEAGSEITLPASAEEAAVLNTATEVSKEDIALAYSAIIDGEPVGQRYADPEQVSKVIAERIKNAESFDEAFAPQELPAWTNYLEIPVFVKSFHLNPTGYKVQGGPTVYAVVEIAEAIEGREDTVTCGGRNVLVQLMKMLENDWFDKPVMLISKDTAEGYKALWLKAVTLSATVGEAVPA
jgi:hypothetical protein